MKKTQKNYFKVKTIFCMTNPFPYPLRVKTPLVEEPGE